MTGAAAKTRVRLETKTERHPLPPGAVLVVDHAPRCWRCHLPLMEKAARPWSKRCQNCGAQNGSEPG